MSTCLYIINIYIYLFRVNILIAILCNVISIILKIAKIQFINSVYCYFLEFFGMITSSFGPLIQLGAFINIIGSFGILAPISAA